MSSTDPRLASGEHVCYRARMHWIVLFGPIALGVLFGVPGLLLTAIAVIFWIDSAQFSAQ